MYIKTRAECLTYRNHSKYISYFDSQIGSLLCFHFSREYHYLSSHQPQIPLVLLDIFFFLMANIQLVAKYFNPTQKNPIEINTHS